MPTRYLWRALSLSLLILGSGFGQVQAAGPATSITVTPATATITADQTVTFSVTATDANGASTTVTTDSTFSTNDPLGSMLGAVYSAGKVGQWTIRITYQNFTTNATVTVTPGVLAEIDVNPDSQPEVVVRGQFRTFTAKGFDQHNNVVTDFRPVWVVSATIGTIDNAGRFASTAIGTGTVEARSPNGVIDQVAVMVREPAPEPTNTNTTTNVNNNSNGNTNTAVTNQNSGANTNVAAGNANITLAPTSTIGDGAIQCTTLKNSLWVLIVIAYLALTALLFAFIPVTRIWPVMIALGGAIILVVVYQNYGCSLLAWWPWVLTIGTVGLTMLALRQAPKKSQ